MKRLTVDRAYRTGSRILSNLRHPARVSSPALNTGITFNHAMEKIMHSGGLGDMNPSKVSHLRYAETLSNFSRIRSSSADALRFQAWVGEGNSSSEDTPFRVIYAGIERHKRYIFERAFGDQWNEQYLGRCPAEELVETGGRWTEAVSAVIFEVNSQQEPNFQIHSRFCIPCWVSLQLELPERVSDFSRSERWASLRQEASRNAYDYQISTNSSILQLFYRSLYAPYTAQYATAEVNVCSRQEVERKLSQGELLIASGNAGLEGGIIIEYPEMHEAVLSCFCARDGLDSSARRSLMSAVYFQALKRVQSRGFNSVHLGPTRPFIRDVGFQFKTTMGARIVTSMPQAGSFLTFCFLKTGGAVTDFLENNPFLSRDAQENLSAVYMNRNPELSERKFLQEKAKYHPVGGVKGIHVYTPGDLEAPETFALGWSRQHKLEELQR